MQFITQGDQLLTSNLNVARGRMFLMTADVPKPDADWTSNYRHLASD